MRASEWFPERRKCSKSLDHSKHWHLATNEVPHPVASGATYEGHDTGVNPISVVTECDWHSKGCGRPVTSHSHADAKA